MKGDREVDTTERAVARLFAAIESRDLRRVSAALAPDTVWENVGEPPVVGRDAVVARLGAIVTWSDRVRWDVESRSVVNGSASVVRLDRFWIAGVEHAVRCDGTLTVGIDALVTAVRDVCDLAGWRRRIGPVMESLAARRASDVIERHLAAVRDRDPVAMAADYHLDAHIVRGADQIVGYRAIADHFDTVSDRLGAHTLELGQLVTDGAADGDDHIVRWTISDPAGATVASGSDRYTIERGRIALQIVSLDTPCS